MTLKKAGIKDLQVSGKRVLIRFAYFRLFPAKGEGLIVKLSHGVFLS